jgi:type III pantothenate kinase
MTSTDTQPPLVAVDIGNSRIKIGRFDAAPKRDIGPEPAATLELPLANRNGELDTAALANWCHVQLTGTATWLVSSVHRGAAERLQASVLALARKAGFDWSMRALTYRDVPIGIEVDLPERVGMDRLLAAVAADRLRPRDRPAIVVDMGTATTVDLVTARGAFAGGAILPGLAMSAHALAEQTDGLPQVPIDTWTGSPAPLGKSTVPAIESGLFWGAVGAIRELVSRISAPLLKPPVIYLSGGASSHVAEALAEIGDLEVHLVPHLVLDGIAAVHHARA